MTKIDRDRYQTTREMLHAKFPDCIGKDGVNSKRPLKIGIVRDLYAADLGISNAEVRNFLRAYTSGLKYLKSISKGGDRYDLAGQPCGVITPEQSTYAAEKLARINKHMSARRKARKATIITTDLIAA